MKCLNSLRSGRKDGGRPMEIELEQVLDFTRWQNVVLALPNLQEGGHLEQRRN